MGPQRFEVESEAWYRAVAEGRVGAGSDRKDGQSRPSDPKVVVGLIRSTS